MSQFKSPTLRLRVGPAVWHSKEYDYPVEIVRFLGEMNGEEYYLVRTTLGETGIPRSQLEQEPDYIEDARQLLSRMIKSLRQRS